MRSIGLVLAILFLPLQAIAYGWKHCDGTSTIPADNEASTDLNPSDGRGLCFIGDSSIVASPSRLDGRRCMGGIDVFFDADITSSSVDALIQVYYCRNKTSASVTGCEKVLVDTTGDGVVDDVMLNGDVTAARYAIYGISPSFIKIQWDTPPTGADLAEARVVCRAP
jgi:hypothetical protein